MSFTFGFGLHNHTTPCLRVAYDPATDLATEDPANKGKFLIDSLNGGSISYFYEIAPINYDTRYRGGGWGPNDVWFFNNHDFNTPYTASNIFTTCGAMIWWNDAGTGAQTYFFLDTWWDFGFMPYFEYRFVDPNLPANTYKGAVVDYGQFQVSGSGYVISTAGYNSQTTSCGANINLIGSNYELSRRGYNVTTKSANPNTIANWIYSVWQIPAMNEVMPDFSAAPVTGQEVLALTPTVARLALPGRTVSDPNPDHYIFHENKIPAKVMRAGDITIAGSATAYINCPLPLTPMTYMDFMIKRSSDPEFWNPPYFDSISSDKSLAFHYTIDLVNNRVVINNGTSTSVTIRYVILADSADLPTTGGKEILRKGNDGTRDFVQIKRPGSSDVSPNLNDIIVDTRLAYLPILAQGFLNWSADFPTVISGGNRFKGERMATVSIPNPSPKLKLFVKQNVVYNKKGTPYSSMANFHKVYTDAGSWTGRASGNSSWANVRSTEDAIDFYMAGDNPIGYSGTDGASYNGYYGGVGAHLSPDGLNYVVLGIPNSL